MMPAGRRSGRAGRVVTDDEAELWAAATRSLERVHGKPRVGSAASAAAPPGEAPARRHDAPEPRPQRPPGGPVKTGGAAPLTALDRRQARRLGAGKAEIDDRIDLHGLRQAEAHARLRAFLHRAYAKGFKIVLVITGKGAPADDADHLRAAMGERQPGVLRRNVPLWLAQPELSPIVLSYGAAGNRHGGSGAFYVRLRKAKR